MTSVKISGGMGCWEMCNFPISQHPVTLIPMSHGIKARSHTQSDHQGPRKFIRPANLWFLDWDGHLIRNYVISQWVWILAIIITGCCNIHSSVHLLFHPLWYAVADIFLLASYAQL